MSDPTERDRELWQQGRTLVTAQTRRWSKAQWEENERYERRLVLRLFSSVDEGRSRELVCVCETAEQAEQAVAWHNAAVARARAEGAREEAAAILTKMVQEASACGPDRLNKKHWYRLRAWIEARGKEDDGDAGSSGGRT